MTTDCNQHHVAGNDIEMLRIVIVGAGVSGLMCARRLKYLLQKQPYKIMILEARDRIGGRTFSIPELNLDLGASWIFSHHTAVRVLARELNIGTIEQYETGVSLMSTRTGSIQPVDMGQIHGDAKRLQGGTGSLCTAMIDELMAHNEGKITLQLNSPVANITCKDNEFITITMRDQSTIIADYVILALPPKLLTSNIHLTPSLSLAVTKQLNKCVTWMASTCKAILVYERAWWQDRKLSGFAVSRQNRAQEWHDASSSTCKALFVFCLAATTKQHVIDATIQMFGNDAANPTVVYMTDWSNEIFTSSSANDGAGGHPYVDSICRQSHWNGRLWLSSSEVSDVDGGYIEGAVRRGTQVADQLAALIMTNQSIN